MRTWQDIFAEKIADKCLTEPWTLQKDDTLQVHVLKTGWKEFVQGRAPGRFQCSQYFQEWSSAKVHVLFHEPEFSLETVERLLHNLVLKILKYFYHVRIQPSDLLEVVVDVLVTGLHDSAHCEGCQLGICMLLFVLFYFTYK
ncbi:PREDICTED: receptor-transporting protein 4-like [Nestor notabilis]|uniref:receptor-transporting protein 4-like n=1 Tax=Nestor notabilis TaxID=176057 RepID=UPI000523EBE6|nr:PREDICTED: receptor-transporting protein 4-like [Nestor notabilis]